MSMSLLSTTMSIGKLSYFVLMIKLCVYSCHSKDCQTVASDILFLLDASDSIGQHVYHTQIIPFFQNFIRKPTLGFGPGNTQIGAVAFANGQHIDLPLKNFPTKNELLIEIQTYMSFHGGATDTHNALNYVRENMFTKDKGDRAWAENVLVIMTDGGSSIPSETLKEIYNLKRQNVTIYVVPVGNCRLYWNEIYSMATSSQHVITDLNHIDIYTATQQLWRQICRAATTFSQFSPITKRPQLPVFIPLFPTAATTPKLPPTTKPLHQHIFFTANIRLPSHLPCVDADPDCATYPPDVCTTSKDWAKSSCRKTCSLCEAPITTTPKPTTTTPKPTTTTPKPTTTTPKPTTTTPKPTTTTPKPTTTTSKPTTTTPKPTTTTPKPTTTTPKPTTTTPKPTTTTPKPPTTTPKPTTKAPNPQFITATCDDQDPFCSTYSLAVCKTDPVWAFGSCRKTCGLCHSISTTSKPTTTTPKPTTRKATAQRHHYVTIRTIVREKGGGLFKIKF